VIEVEESPKDMDAQQLNAIREKVSQQPGWRFVLMLPALFGLLVACRGGPASPWRARLEGDPKLSARRDGCSCRFIYERDRVQSVARRALSRIVAARRIRGPSSLPAAILSRHLATSIGQREQESPMCCNQEGPATMMR